MAQILASSRLVKAVAVEKRKSFRLTSLSFALKESNMVYNVIDYGAKADGTLFGELQASKALYYALK